MSEALVVGVSRRHVSLLDEAGNIFIAQAGSKALNITVGDKVRWRQHARNPFIFEVLAPRNSLIRTYRNEQRRIAANLDHLLIVTAGGALFNTIFIDRVLVVTHYESIPITLVINKSDLGFEDIEAPLSTYRQLGYSIVIGSAKHDSVSPLLDLLDQDKFRIVALTGVSGVGKSTLLNQLIPEANRKTGVLSRKTGQGRQTTSQPFGYLYKRENLRALLVIDLPGIQNFGVTHLERHLIADAFPEFMTNRSACAFSDCSHIGEADCGIKTAIANGKIAKFRYESYINMIDEIEEAKEY